MKYQFKAVYDNLVTNDIVRDIFEANSIDEAEEYAYQRSGREGLSRGNYDLYIKLGRRRKNKKWVGGTWIDICEVLDAAGVMDQAAEEDET